VTADDNFPTVMKKTSIQILLGCLLTLTAHAEFRTWTRSDGKTAELELVAVSETADGKSGEFKMRNGRSITLPASSLSEADAQRLAEWKPAETENQPAAETGGSSVFDKILDGNLEKLSGKSLKSFKDLKKPTKYYVFYYTASWCGPCQQYTPSLVKFYE
jgi:hypothetical protein